PVFIDDRFAYERDLELVRPLERRQYSIQEPTIARTFDIGERFLPQSFPVDDARRRPFFRARNMETAANTCDGLDLTRQPIIGSFRVVDALDEDGRLQVGDQLAGVRRIVDDDLVDAIERLERLDALLCGEYG